MTPQQVKPIPVCRVRYRGTNDAAGFAELRFQRTFFIGRTEECEVCIKNSFVSRKHAEVSFEAGEWWARDLNSSNGLYVAGERVQRVALSGTTIRLGIEGPEVSFALEKLPEPQLPEPVPLPSAGERTMVAQYVNRYFSPVAASQPAGEHTMYVRRAFEQVQAKQRSKYRWLIVALGVSILGLVGYAFFQHQQLAKQEAMAKDIFYSMKAVDVEIANLEKLLLSSPSQAGAQEVRSFQQKRAAMGQSYDRFLATLHVYDPKMSPQDRLILRVARIFGECELDIPPNFISEVKKYIQRWQSSGRLERAIETANNKGYTRTITKEFLANDLPPQFFYLALQESNFDPYISGPLTRKGIAKGMWQFIPETAVKYGLHLGPLVDLPRPDPADDRHRYERETKAAAQYIKDLYATEAQASGLLVMACYNWGEDSVLPLVRQLPENPRERNFWRLLANDRGKLPQETYDYVFYIVSAAVVGEDPHAFGFHFNDPIAASEHQ